MQVSPTLHPIACEQPMPVFSSWTIPESTQHRATLCLVRMLSCRPVAYIRQSYGKIEALMNRLRRQLGPFAFSQECSTSVSDNQHALHCHRSGPTSEDLRSMGRGNTRVCYMTKIRRAGLMLSGGGLASPMQTATPPIIVAA